MQVYLRYRQLESLTIYMGTMWFLLSRWKRVSLALLLVILMLDLLRLNRWGAHRYQRTTKTLSHLEVTLTYRAKVQVRHGSGVYQTRQCKAWLLVIPEYFFIKYNFGSLLFPCRAERRMSAAFGGVQAVPCDIPPLTLFQNDINEIYS